MKRKVIIAIVLLLFLVFLAGTSSFLALIRQSSGLESLKQSSELEPLSAFFADVNGAASSYASVDYGVTHNGNPSIRVGPDYVRGTREVDGAWINVTPGDHIVYTVWVKTDPNVDEQGNPDQYYGARFGCDLYAYTSEGYGVVDTHPNTTDNSWLNPVNFRLQWGNDWTKLTWDFYIPSTYYTTVYTQVGWDTQSTDCNSVQIDSMVPWFDARDLTSGPYAWFSDPSLVINP